ncbi:MAG TPA: alpha/beta hydrolase [Bacteroidia bacterium]|nr:alpha/beta hydrolase [Bacteroidia bacterium]
MKKPLKYIEFKNGKIAFTDHGKGRAIVLLHGFLLNKEIWEETRNALSKHFRIICIDLPGHGKSDCFGYVHGMDLMAKSVKAVMDKLRLKKYVLVGHSMGGYAALAFAELFPEQIKGLCLFHSTSYADSDKKKHDRDKAIKSVKSDPNIYIRATVKNLFATKNLKFFKKQITFATQIARKTPKQGIVDALEGMKDRPSRDVILHFADYPIQFIVGKYDNLLPMQSLLDQTKLCKHRHTLFLENSGHMGFLEQPDTCIKFLKRFARICFKSKN